MDLDMSAVEEGLWIVLKTACLAYEKVGSK